MRRENERKPLVTHIYTADPSAHVFDGKIYIYPSHDEALDVPEDDDGEQYQMHDYHILSMDSLDSPCVDNGLAMAEEDVPWVGRQLWAPDAAYVNGKYYLIFPAKDKQDIFRIGVAFSDNPAGPFTPYDHYIEGSYSIDPAVLVDCVDENEASASTVGGSGSLPDSADGGLTNRGKAGRPRIYCYYGGLWGGQLEMWQKGYFDPSTPRPAGDEPALGPMFAEFNEDLSAFVSKPKMLTILDENGEPLKASDEDRRYFEGPWMHKFGGKYYLSYSTGTTHYLCYAESDHPDGPFTYKGRIMEPVIGWTTHHSIVEIDGEWYLFYHDAEYSGGVSHERTVKYTKLTIHEDGTIDKIWPYDEN